MNLIEIFAKLLFAALFFALRIQKFLHLYDPSFKCANITWIFHSLWNVVNGGLIGASGSDFCKI